MMANGGPKPETTKAKATRIALSATSPDGCRLKSRPSKERMMKLKLKLSLVDDIGRTHGEIWYDLDDSVAFKGERIADDFRFDASVSAMPFDGAVQVLREKTFRRDLLTACAKRAGAALCDQLEDREGWHGEDRQEKTEARLRTKSR
jgi:hypothetical protein